MASVQARAFRGWLLHGSARLSLSGVWEKAWASIIIVELEYHQLVLEVLDMVRARVLRVRQRYAKRESSTPFSASW